MYLGFAPTVALAMFHTYLKFIFQQKQTKETVLSLI